MDIYKIKWKNDGWTVIQEADARKHVLEITCLAENGVVTEIRKRHNDGEEEKLTKAIDSNHPLPMKIDDLKACLKKGEIDW